MNRNASRSSICAFGKAKEGAMRGRGEVKPFPMLLSLDYSNLLSGENEFLNEHAQFLGGLQQSHVIDIPRSQKPIRCERDIEPSP